MSRVLIREGCVLTMGRTNHPRADVLIVDGLIQEIGSGLRARDAEVIDADGAIVMPGFVDAHRHAWETLFRNMGEPVGVDRLGPHYGADDVYAGTLVALLSALDAGITTVVDWCAGVEQGRLEAARRAHAESGARTVLVAGAAPWSGEPWERVVGRAVAMAGPRLTAAAGPGPGDDWSPARAAGLRIHAHAGTSPEERGAIGRLAARLGPDVTFVHCSHADDADLDAVTDAG
ncbi:MAG TPA: hypothetical protein VK960_02495, partial [Acidimicrobiia bacterium]|nr:hypothetical protein [Acidimicrobiia bacterium]